MEQPAKSSKAKPIGLLIADGREVAQRLEPALRAKGTPKRVEALQVAVKPYLQLVVSGERDEFTNLPLGDVWRYFRYSWCIPQLPIPGRQLLYLIRDAAHPYHAVMGIASLNNCAMQNKVRDDRIGWTGEAFLTHAREVALPGGQGAGKELKEDGIRSSRRRVSLRGQVDPRVGSGQPNSVPSVFWTSMTMAALRSSSVRRAFSFWSFCTSS
jgi:hypothetical protein